MVAEAEPNITTVQMPALYPKQRDIFYSPARMVLCEATTKAGKTVGGLHWLATESLADQEQRTRYWISPTYPEAETYFLRLERWMLQADPNQTVWESWKTHPPKMRFGKSFIIFKGADKPDRLYGPDCAGAVLDEASRMKEAAYLAVRSTCVTLRAPMRIIGNVKGRKNWAYKMARKAESGERDHAYFKLTAYDAAKGFASIGIKDNVMDLERIEDARREMTENDWKELFLAEPSEDGSNPFGMQHIAACISEESGETPVAFGADLAQSRDWTVLIGLDKAGVVADFDRWQGLAWADTERRILNTIGRVPLAVDETGVGKPVTERLQRGAPGFEQVEGFMFSSRSKQQLMAQLAVAIQQRRVSFPDGPIRAELESFEFSFTGKANAASGSHDFSGVKYSAPTGAHDDCVMALALAVLKHDKVAHAPCATIEWADRGMIASRSGPQAAYAERRKDPNFGFDD